MSFYKVGESSTGIARVYGSFPDCRILGHDCTIHVTPLSDADPQVADLGGTGTVFTRGRTAIHISGLDPYGARTGSGFIKAIGLYEIEWHDTDDPPAGLGCRRPEPAAIITWDGDITGRSHRTDEWQHHALFSPCDAIVTLDGVVEMMRARYGDPRNNGTPFTPLTICQMYDEIHGRSAHDLMSYTDKQHVSAVRRLCETMVNIRNSSAHSEYVLCRSGRWSYTWRER